MIDVDDKHVHSMRVGFVDSHHSFCFEADSRCLALRYSSEEMMSGCVLLYLSSGKLLYLSGDDNDRFCLVCLISVSEKRMLKMNRISTFWEDFSSHDV